MQLDKSQDSVLKSYESILSKQGPAGFYQGLTPLIIGNAFAYGVYFVAYEKLKGVLGVEVGSMVGIAKCSGLAGAIGTLLTNPFYVLQTRQSKENRPILQIT